MNIRNQKGSAGFLAILAIVIVLVFAMVIKHHSPKTKALRMAHHEVHKIKPQCGSDGQCKGAYVYQNGNDWFWYWVVLGNNTSPQYNAYAYSTASSSLSNYNGSWQKGPAVQEEEVAQTQDAEVIQNEEGNPTTVEEGGATAAEGNDAANNADVSNSETNAVVGDGGLDSGSASVSEPASAGGSDSSSSGSYDSGGSFDSGSSSGDSGGSFDSGSSSGGGDF